MKVKIIVTRTKDGIVVDAWDIQDSPSLTKLVDRRVYTWYEVINMMRGEI
jgi:hypothetical protein